MNSKIVVLAGDGIGPEIMDSGLQVLAAVEKKCAHTFELEELPFGGAGIDEAGASLPEKTLTACHQADAILLGAIGGPKWEKMQDTPEKGLLALRKALNLFANIRPVSVSSALLHLSPLKPEILEGTDLIIVRELSSGIYFGEPRELTDTMAYDTARYQKEEIERILHSLGVLPSASHSDGGPSLYEPIHGSAPDIAGKGIANPISMILSVAMMLRQSFQEEQAAKAIEKACDTVLSKGLFTHDLGGQATTAEFTDAVIQELEDAELWAKHYLINCGIVTSFMAKKAPRNCFTLICI